jgi:hypothetical protein
MGENGKKQIEAILGCGANVVISAQAISLTGGGGEEERGEDRKLVAFVVKF